jgi:ACS family hexuronate transporter-like MFS transporter
VRFSILALLFLATALNYIDRASLGVMQPVLAQAMSWTAFDYANINFWFQVGYAIGFAAQGRFIDWVGVKRAFALAVCLWSLAAAAHGLAASALGFMVCRFFLGLTEAANFPACVKTARLWFPASERALAAGFFNAGATVGAMLTPAILPPILAAWGWQAAFFITAALGFFWILVWLRHYHDPDEHPRLSREELAHVQKDLEPEPAGLPYSRVVRLRATWAFTLAYSMTVPVFWFYLYWLPPFLNQQYQLGIHVDQIGLPLIVIYLSADLGGIVGGGFSSYLIARGTAPAKARLVSMAVSALCLSPIVAASRAGSLWMAVAAISVALGAHQSWITNMYGLLTDVTPKSVVASVFGFGSMVAAVGGMFMTQIVGYVLTTTGNNYGVLFTLIPATYWVALAWMYSISPRKIEECN